MTIKSFGLVFLFSISCFLILFSFVFAERITSDNFIVPSDTITPGSFSSSDNFRMFSNITQISIGTSTSSSFDLSAGFLAFPKVTVAVTPAKEAEKVTTTSSEGIVLSLLKNFLTPSPLLPTLKVSVPKKCPVGTGAADLNCDGRVDIKDLGIFLYFMPQQIPNPADINEDKVVNSNDLSRLFFGWTERFIAFQPEKIPILSNGFNTGLFDSTKQPNRFFLERTGTAAISESVSSDSAISGDKKGFSTLLRGIKSLIIKVLLRIKSIF